ncbi:hypothetical protein SDC9_51610 [bioreactor metagenome]|uniref:Fibronectin type III-like domain-containing protein n=1 Tax=bioreactor metagenome TaxID=1076179 RepID=A0A644WNI6_9ZZZZ
MPKQRSFSILGKKRAKIDYSKADLATFASSRRLSEEIAAESAVLLKNDDGFLPIPPGPVNVFGVLGAEPHFGGGGSGRYDRKTCIDLNDALCGAGFTTNRTLFCLYKNWAIMKKISQREPKKLFFDQTSGIGAVKAMLVSPVTRELPQKALSAAVMREAQALSNVAIVVLGRGGSEQHDYAARELALTPEERAMLDRVCGAFERVVVLINSATMMELGFLSEYPQIKSALFFGLPGQCGLRAVARILCGEISPSGRLADTAFYRITDIPAVCNSGSFSYRQTRHKLLEEKRHLLFYKEDIYVGYRYTETFLHEDTYRETVQFPFGFGSSYTSFGWSDFSLQRRGNDRLIASLTVANMGGCGGKDVVELFVSAPKSGRLEKPEKVLIGFAKTRLLAQGETQRISTELRLRDAASYDSQNECFVLEAGDYIVEAGLNAHTPVCQAALSLEHLIEYRTDDVTGVPIRNRLSRIEGSFKRLSRSDPEGTMPVPASGKELEAPQGILDFTSKEAPLVGGEMPLIGVNNSLKLNDLAGRAPDDPLWQTFVEQFTLDELADLVIWGCYQTLDIPRLGIPETICADGPMGVHDGDLFGTTFPSEFLLACSWNTDLAARLGVALANEARIFGISMLYGPAMNCHRSPIGGRCFEYYCEDPLLSGKMAAAEVRAAQENGLVTMIKHFAINEEDKHRGNGHVWVSEQAAREIYLRPFEMAVKQGGAHGVLSAINCIGETWCGESRELLTDILRTEWGFQGCCITDSASVHHMRPDTGVPAGSDLWLVLGLDRYDERNLKKQLKKDPAGMARALQRACRNICWTVLQSNARERL